MRSTVNAAVLALVIDKGPSYGGEIGRQFERRYGELLSSRPQHVYKALEDLEQQGLIERIELDEPDWAGRQARVHYRGTGEGARAYLAWLRSPIPAGSRTRNEIMIRLASTRVGDAETAERLLTAYETAVLAVVRQAEVPASAGVIDRLVDEERRTLGDAQLRWISRARDTVREWAGARER